MSEARAITNLIGNGVATMVVARWEGEFDVDRAQAVLDRRVSVDDELDALPEAATGVALSPAGFPEQA